MVSPVGRRGCWLTGACVVPPDGDRIAVGLEEGLYVIELTRDGECKGVSRTGLARHSLPRAPWRHSDLVWHGAMSEGLGSIPSAVKEGHVSE